MKLSEDQLKELAAQLYCPSGAEGIKVAEMMHSTNGNIIAKTIASLNLSDNDTVLEIGPGNGRHAGSIINNAKDVRYYGVDISETMVTEAGKAFEKFENAAFVLSDGNKIPFNDGYFTKAFTVNTIYFWKDTHSYAQEIYRVLKTGGIFSIGFIPERIMQKIPFAKYGFNMYSEGAVQNILETTGFKITSLITEKELISGNSKEVIERELVIISAKKG